MILSSRFTSSALGERREMLRRLRNLHYRALLCSFFKRKPQIGQQTKPTKEECKFEKIKIQHTNTADSAHKNHSDNSTNSQMIFLNPNMSFKATVPKAGRAFPFPAVVGPSQPQSWDAQGCKAEPGTQMSHKSWSSWVQESCSSFPKLPC